MLELLLPEGRIVKGHPLFDRPVTDDNNRPVLDDNGKQKTKRYVAFAIPKNGSTDWKQTEWGLKIVQAASDPACGYNSAEQMSPRFSWKIDDGDDVTANTAGSIPSQQEGYPGHWVIHFTTVIPYAVYANGNYAVPITNKDEVKTGDFGRFYMGAKANGPKAKTPGVYLNPLMLEITRAGQQIVSNNLPSAASVFGGATPAPSAPTTPPPAAPAAPNVPPAPPSPPAPAEEEKYNVNGAVYTRSQLLAMPGWTEEHLANQPRA